MDENDLADVAKKFEGLLRAQMAAGKSRKDGLKTLRLRYPRLFAIWTAAQQPTASQRRLAEDAIPRGSAAAEGNAEAVRLFEEKVGENEKLGFDRREAVRLAVKQHPALHQQFLMATNSQKASEVEDAIRMR